MNYRVCFAAYLRRRGRRPATIRRHILTLAEFCSYCRKSGRRTSIIKSLHPARLNSYRDHLLTRRRLRPSTVNARLSSMSAFCRFLIEKGILPGNPLEMVARVGREGEVQIKPRASWEDVQRLRREVSADILNLRGRIVIELLYSGLTVRELCLLPWEDQSSPVLRAGPGRRRVELEEATRQALQHYLLLRPILRGSYLIVGNSPDWSLTPAAVYGLLKRINKKLGLAVTVRDLRLARAYREAAQPAADMEIAA